MSRELPKNPNIEYLRKEAKALLRAAQEGTMKLADAQHALAREYGSPSWPKLVEHVRSLSRVLTPDEMLLEAVRASSASRTARVLDRRPELRNHLDEPLENYGWGTLLLAAVQRTDGPTVDVLLQAGADIHARSRHWSGGMGVMDECAPDFAAFLIERGAVVDVHAAARLAMMDRLRELVNADPGAVHARGAGGQTPLHFSSTVEVAEYLLARGADIDALDLRHESTPAQCMLRVVQARHYRHDRQDIARYLVSHGCRTDILMAAALGDFELAQRIVAADPECVRTRVTEEYFPKGDPRSDGTIYIQQFGQGRTPHQVARDFQHRDVYDFLVRNSPQDVIVAQALELGDEEVFRRVIAEHPELAKTEERKVADAAQNNNLNAVRLMLAAGWPVDARGEYSMTPLQWASWHGNAGMVREILRYGPQLELDCDHRITAIGSVLHGSKNGWHRATGDYAATAEALLEAGAKAPRVTEDLEGSEEALEVLRSWEEERPAD